MSAAGTECPSTNTIAELVCRTLGAAKASEVEDHVSNCATCRRVVGTLAAASLARLGEGSGPHDEPAPDRAPHRYVIQQELARGGMGRISIAEDTLLHRTVAIKELIAPRAELTAMFEHELALTARLQHPSIVSIHDGGTWPTGEPFYVMRLVAGEPLDRVIARAGTTAARIALLPHALAMVDALAYAHAQRIVHRDLKPANVLVGGFGETVVIDWGLARDLGADGSEPFGERVVGTPAYMAPEQASGAPVDERADVFALGAVLYHLLSGAPPYTGASATAILDAVAAGPPPPLAERAAGAPPDLLAIVDKAMARRADDRYASARELAIDLAQFQRGQLVGAHRYSSWQLVRRWLRRHRGAVAVGAAAVVVLIAVGVASVERVVGEQRRAERSRADAEQLLTFMLTDLHDRLQPVGKLDLIGAVAARARDYFASHEPAATPDDSTDRIFALENLGEVLDGQGDRAGAVIELRTGAILADVLAVAAPDDVKRQRLAADCHSRIGTVLHEQLDESAALVELELSLAIDKRLADRDPADREVSADLSIELERVGELLAATGDLAGAIEKSRASLAIGTRLVALEPTNAKWLEQLAESHAQLGELLRATNDTAGALVEHRAALAAEEELLRRDPANTGWQLEALDYHLRVGAALEDTELTAALAEYRAALAIGTRLVARDATNDRWQCGVAMAQTQIGGVLQAQGDREGAAAAFRAAIASAQALVASVPSSAAARRQLVAGHAGLGRVLLAGDDFPGAVQQLRTALGLAEQLAANDPAGGIADDLTVIRNNLANALLQQGATAEAIEQLHAALALAQQRADRDPHDVTARRDLARDLLNLGDALVAKADRDGARAQYGRALAICEPLVAQHPTDRDALGELFDAHDKLGDTLAGDEALAEYRAALDLIEQLVAIAPTVADYQRALASTHQEIGDALRGHGAKRDAAVEYRAALAADGAFARMDPSAKVSADIAGLRAKLAD